MDDKALQALLQEIEQNKVAFEADNETITEEIKATYEHSPPEEVTREATQEPVDFTKYYYLSNPRTNPDTPRILRNSPNGKQIAKLIAKRNQNLTKIQTLNRLKTRLTLPGAGLLLES